MPISPPINIETAILANERNKNNERIASSAFFNAIMFAQLQGGSIKDFVRPSSAETETK